MSRLFPPAVLLALQLLLTGCAGVLWYEPIAGGTPASTVAPGARLAEKPIATLENPYLRNRGRANAEAVRRFERANAALAREEWPLAMSELEWLLAHHPNLSGPSLNMALAHHHQGDAERAERYFRQALQVNPDNLDAYNQYAIFLREQGRFQDAERNYLQALDVWNMHANTHRNIGVLYDMYMGDRKGALLHFHRYQELTDADDRTVAGWIVDLERQRMLLVKGS